MRFGGACKKGTVVCKGGRQELLGPGDSRGDAAWRGRKLPRTSYAEANLAGAFLATWHLLLMFQYLSPSAMSGAPDTCWRSQTAVAVARM